MNPVYISVILPTISDESMLIRFCSSLFATKINVELCICDRISEEMLIALNENYGEKIKIFYSDNPVSALNNAIKNLSGNYFIFSDVSVNFSSDCFETMLISGNGSFCVSNIAVIDGENSTKAYREDFSYADLRDNFCYYNYLFDRKTVEASGISLNGNDAFSILLFIADLMRYELPVCINKVLFYTDSFKNCGVCSADVFKGYTDVFALSQVNITTLFFISLCFKAFSENFSDVNIDAIKYLIFKFADNDLLIAWIDSEFGIDSLKLLSDDSIENIDIAVKSKYTEIVLPINSRDVIMNFYSGKFGVDVLKKCIGAWLYYKLFRRKNDVIKKYGCKICRRLLGGEFDV